MDEVDSNLHRYVTRRTGIEMIKAHPWFGIGPEMPGKQFQQYLPADIKLPLPEGFYGHLHNVYLQYGAERGIPALLAFLWMIGMMLHDWWTRAQIADHWGTARDSSRVYCSPDRISDRRFIRKQSWGQRGSKYVLGGHCLGISRMGGTSMTVILAGGSGGLGSEAARMLAAGGFELVISYKSNRARAERFSDIRGDCASRSRFERRSAAATRFGDGSIRPGGL